MKTTAIAIFLGLSLIAAAIYFKSPRQAPSLSPLTSRISESEIKDAVEKTYNDFPDGISSQEKEANTLRVTDIRTNDSETEYKIFYQFRNAQSKEILHDVAILSRDNYGVWTTRVRGVKIMIKEIK